MNNLGNEETLVELPTIKYLCDNLGYDLIEWEKLTPDYGERDTFSDVILNKRMKKSIKKLNPWISNENAEKVKTLSSQHLTSSAVIGCIEPITLFDDDFQTKIENQSCDEAIASSMEHAIRNSINLKDV